MSEYPSVSFPSDGISSFSSSGRSWLLSQARQLAAFHRSQAEHWESIEKQINSEVKNEKISKSNENNQNSSTVERIKSSGAVQRIPEDSNATKNNVMPQLPLPTPVPSHSASFSIPPTAGISNPNSAVARRHSAFMDGLAMKLGGKGPGVGLPIPIPIVSHAEDDEEEKSSDINDDANRAILSRAVPKRRRPSKLIRPANTAVRLSNAAPLPMTFVSPEDEQQSPESVPIAAPEPSSLQSFTLHEATEDDDGISFSRGSVDLSSSNSFPLSSSPVTRNRNMSFNQPVPVIQPEVVAAPPLPSKPRKQQNSLSNNGESNEEIAKLKQRALPSPPGPTGNKEKIEPEIASPRAKPATPQAATSPIAAAAAENTMAGQRMQRRSIKMTGEEESDGPNGELMKKLQRKREEADGNGVSAQSQQSQSQPVPAAISAPSQACKSCGCAEFKPNAFKKGCSNCFHEH